MTAEVLRVARSALDAGICVVPPNPTGTKQPWPNGQPRWEEWQHRLPTDDEIQRWFGNGCTGVGFVCGTVSGGVELFEFEGRAVEAGLPKDFAAAAEAAGLLELVQRIAAGYRERSPGGGLHLIYRCTETANLKLAQGPGHETLIETKGEGGYVIVAPSHGAVHPTGRPWTIERGGVATIVTITPEERTALHGLARTFDQAPKPEWHPPPAHDRTHAGWILRPGDAYNDTVGWPEILEPFGWTHMFTAADGNQHWRRPGKDRGTCSATVADNGAGPLYVFSSSTPFDPGRAYSRFAAYGILHHNGDWTAAGKALAELGYGEAEHAEAGDKPTTPGDEPTTGGRLRLQTLKARLLDGNQLDQLPPPRPLIDAILTLDTIAALYGPPGVGKSFVVADWALSVATGTWWLGHEVHQGPVIYVAAEGQAGLGQRKRAWEKAHNVQANGYPIHWVPMPVNLRDPEWVEGLALLAAEIQPALIVIDTLARCMPGGDENSSSDMGAVVEAADRLRLACHSTVLFAHHSPKEADTLRGHSSLEGAVETIISAGRDGHTITLKSKKQKDLPDFEPIRLHLREVDESCAIYSQTGVGVNDDLAGSEEDLMAVIGSCSGSDGLSPSELQRVSELASSSFYRALKALVKRGLVINVGSDKRPRYTLKESA